MEVDGQALACWLAVKGQSPVSTWPVVAPVNRAPAPAKVLSDRVCIWEPAGYHCPYPVEAFACTDGKVSAGRWKRDVSGPERPAREKVTVKISNSRIVEYPFKFSRKSAGALHLKRLSPG